MKLQGFRVCLEAGHGYHDFDYDPGATANGFEEHKLNVAQVKHVAKLLRDQGCDVTTVICEIDNAMTLKQRSLVSTGHDLFVSFHHNAANGKAQGTEVLGHTLATALDMALAADMSKRIASDLNYRDRGAKKQNLGVLRYVPKTVTAAVLVESYFMDNEALKGTDLEALSLKAADAAAEGIAQFLMANCMRRAVIAPEPPKIDLGPSEPKKSDKWSKPWKKG